MPLNHHYQCDEEFAKLVARDSNIDLTIIALELARDAYPQLNFSPTLDWIEQRSQELAPKIGNAFTEREVLESLSHWLSETWGLYGSPGCFDNIDACYLNRVVETGQGIPISLSLVYLAVAKHLGLELVGVAAPVRFYLRSESSEGTLFIDPFAKGALLSEDEALTTLMTYSSCTPSQLEALLQPAHPRTIVIRMLNNLKSLYLKHDDWLSAWTIQHRLAALMPGSYQERRDLALISVQADHPGLAIDLLQNCLRTCPKAEQPVLEEHLTVAETLLARWN